MGPNPMCPASRQWTFGPDYAMGNWSCGLFSEDHAYDAWERMTYGGVNGVNAVGWVLWRGELAWDTHDGLSFPTAKELWAKY